MTRAIVAPIRQFSGVFRQMASGDLTGSTDVTSTDVVQGRDHTRVEQAHPELTGMPHRALRDGLSSKFR